jgi:hypothetical protein
MTNKVSVEGQGFQNHEEGPAGFTADELPTVAQPRVGPPLMKAWTRDGFSGSFSVEQPMSYAPDYISAKGPHAPRRFVLSKMKPSVKRMRMPCGA